MAHTRFALFTLLIFAVSCSNPSSGRKSISDEAFVMYYADEIILREESKLISLDSSAIDLKLDSLRKAYDLTEGDVEAELQNRKQSIEEWKSFYSKVVKRLEAIGEEFKSDKKHSG